MTAGELEPGNIPQSEPRHLRNVVVLWIGLSIVGILAVLYTLPYVLPKTASNAGEFANLTILVFTAVAVPVAMFIWVFLGYSLMSFRVHEKPVDDGPRLQPTLIAQLGWLGQTVSLGASLSTS